MYPTIPTRKSQTATRAFRERVQPVRVRNLARTQRDPVRLGIVSIGIFFLFVRTRNKARSN